MTEEPDSEDPDATPDPISLVEAQRRARTAAKDLFDYDFEGIPTVERTDDGWRVVVELLERSAVPDTQDIIGRYELTLDRAGEVTGYDLLERNRRGELEDEL